MIVPTTKRSAAVLALGRAFVGLAFLLLLALLALGTIGVLYLGLALIVGLPPTLPDRSGEIGLGLVLVITALGLIGGALLFAVDIAEENR